MAENRTVDSVVARVRAFAASKGWTRYRYAQEVGISESIIRRMNEPDWNPRVETLRRLESIIPESFAG